MQADPAFQIHAVDKAEALFRIGREDAVDIARQQSGQHQIAALRRNRFGPTAALMSREVAMPGRVAISESRPRNRTRPRTLAIPKAPSVRSRPVTVPTIHQ